MSPAHAQSRAADHRSQTFHFQVHVDLLIRSIQLRVKEAWKLLHQMEPRPAGIGHARHASSCLLVIVDEDVHVVIANRVNGENTKIFEYMCWILQLYTE